MTRRFKFTISLLVLIAFVSGFASATLANTLIPTWSSKGIIDFSGDGSVVFNSEDLNTIYQETIDGRETIATALKNKNPWTTSASQTLAADGSDSYTSLTNAINSQITLPSDSSGAPAIPNIGISYTYYDDENNLQYTYNNVDPTEIAQTAAISTIDGLDIVSSDDLPQGVFAFTSTGKMAVGSGLHETNASQTSYIEGQLQTYKDIAEAKGSTSQYANLADVTNPADALNTLLTDIDNDNIHSRQEVIDNPTSYGLGSGELVLLGKVSSAMNTTPISVDITVDPSLYTGYMLVTNHWGGDFGPYLNRQDVEIGDVISGLNGGFVVGYLPASTFKWPDYTADTYSDSSDYHMFIVQSVQTHNGAAACLGSAWWRTPNVIKLNASYGSQYVYLIGIR